MAGFAGDFERSIAQIDPAPNMQIGSWSMPSFSGADAIASVGRHVVAIAAGPHSGRDKYWHGVTSARHFPTVANDVLRRWPVPLETERADEGTWQRPSVRIGERGLGLQRTIWPFLNLPLCREPSAQM
jgi:hypothetical protein